MQAEQKPEGRLIAGERKYKGNRYFDLRLWMGDGMMATREGITMPVKAVADMAEALAEYAKRQPD